MDIAKNESYDYIFKLLCVGEANVGKTTFLHQYIHDNFANFRSTVGIDIFEKSLIDNNNQRILLQLWDTAGQERYRSLSQSLFRDSLGYLLLFDVTNESSFLSIQDWLTFIDNHSRIDNDLRPPILLIGNKIDLVTRRTIDKMRAENLASDLNVSYMETSAVTGANVKETLRLLIEHIFEYMNKSIAKFYSKQLSTRSICDSKQKRRRNLLTSINLNSKITCTGKKKSCSCI